MSSGMESGFDKYLLIKKNKRGVSWSRDFQDNLEDIDFSVKYSFNSLSKFIGESDYKKNVLKNGVGYVIFLDSNDKRNDIFINNVIKELKKNQFFSSKNSFIWLVGHKRQNYEFISDAYYRMILKAHGIENFKIGKSHTEEDQQQKVLSSNELAVLNTLYFYHTQSILADINALPDVDIPNKHAFIENQFYVQDEIFDFNKLQGLEKASIVNWNQEDYIKLTSNLLAIEQLLQRDKVLDSIRIDTANQSKNQDLLHSLHYTYALLSDVYFTFLNKDADSDVIAIYSQLQSAFYDFVTNLYDYSMSISKSHLHQYEFTDSTLFNRIYASNDAIFKDHDSMEYTNPISHISDHELEGDSSSAIEFKPLFARWMRAGQTKFSGNTSGWLKQMGGDFLGRLGQELSNSMSLIQILGYIQTKHYYELSGELTDEEKLDIQLQAVQLAELAEMPITWAIDTVRYFKSASKVATVRFLTSLSDVISKAFFVFGAFFGVFVDAYSVSVSVGLLNKIKDPKARSGLIFGLITSIFSLVISVVTTIIIIGFVVTSVIASVAAAGATVAAVVSGVMAGVSAATAAVGPIGLAVGILMMVVSGLYTAITTVNRYKEKLNLSVEDQFVLGIRSFFLGIIPVCDAMAGPDIENAYQKIIAKEMYAQFYLDFRESYFTRLVESLAYGSEKLYRVAFTIDGVDVEVDQTYSRCGTGGYESYKPKENVQRNSVVNFDSYDYYNLKKNVNDKDVRTYQPDFPLPVLSDSLDANQGLYLLKFSGYRNLTRSPSGSTVYADPKDDPYKWLQDVNKYPVLLGDFNGDKATDIVRFMDRGLHVTLNGAGFFQTWYQLYRGFSVYRGGYSNQEQYPRMVGDFNGDGYDDIVGFQDEHVEVLINRRLKTYPESEMNLQFGFGGISVIKFPSNEQTLTHSSANAETQDNTSSEDVFKSISTPENNITKSVFTRAGNYKNLNSSPRIVADFNCDRKDDIIGFSDQIMTQAYSITDRNSFNAEFDLSDQTRFSQFKDKAWVKDNLITGDFDGDGCSDLVGLEAEQLVIAFGSKGGDDEVTTTHQSDEYKRFFSESYLNIAVDITNDKKDDILFINKEGDFGILLSQGDGTFESMSTAFEKPVLAGRKGGGARGGILRFKRKYGSVGTDAKGGALGADSNAEWFKYPKQTSPLGKEHQAWLYFGIDKFANTFVGKDHDNAVYVHQTDGQIVRYILGPNTMTSEGGILAIELGDGNDEARGKRDRSNHFYIGEGFKHFIGGEREDKFILNTTEVPEVASILDGGPEGIQPSSFRQPPVYEPTDSLLTYESDLNQNDYFIANVIYINPDDVVSGAKKGFEINLSQTNGHVKYQGDEKKIAALFNIEHATGHNYTGDYLIGSDEFNVLDGFGSISSDNGDVLEGKGGNDLLILHHNTFAYGGPGDDKYIFKASEYSSLITISDTEGDNSIILSSDLEQVVALSSSDNPDDLIFYIDNDNETTTYLRLEGLLKNKEDADKLTFSTRDGFTVVLDGIENDNPNFHFGLNLSYSPKADVKFASDIASSEGKIKVIQDLYHKKIQVVEMNKDLTDVVRVIRDISIPDYATLKPASSDFNDETHGTISNDLFNGGKGQDRLVGRGGEDFYVVTSSDKPHLSGEMRINNYDPAPIDQLAVDILRVDLANYEIQLAKSGEDLLIQDISTDSFQQKDIVIEKFFVSENYRHLYLTDVNDFIYPLLINEKNEAFLGPGTIQGTGSDDDKPDEDGYVKKLMGQHNTRVTLFGMDGDDLLQSKASQEDKYSKGVFDPTNKGDVLLGGDGSDILIDSQGIDILRGEDGNDLIISTIGNDLIDPGKGIDHIVFLPGSRGMKTYLVAVELNGKIEKNKSSKIMVPYDLEQAIYQRLGDDLQIILAEDYTLLTTLETSPEEFQKIIDKALVIHIKDFFKSIEFRRIRIASYDTESLKSATGIDRNLPGRLKVIKQKDGGDILEAYRDKRQENNSAMIMNGLPINGSSVETPLSSPSIEKLESESTFELSSRVASLNANRELALLVQAAASLTENSMAPTGLENHLLTLPENSLSLAIQR